MYKSEKHKIHWTEFFNYLSFATVDHESRVLKITDAFQTIGIFGNQNWHCPDRLDLIISLWRVTQL